MYPKRVAVSGTGGAPLKKLILLVVMAMTLAATLLAVPTKADEKRTASAYPGVPLRLQGAAAAALASTNSTSPADDAGLAAYLRVNPLNVEKTLTAFDHWEQYGNWVKGYISVKLYPAWHLSFSDLSAPVSVYVDSQGWVVAYLPKYLAPANIMMWTGVSQGSSNLTSISTTALDEALKKVLLAAGVDFAPLQGQVGYYHFQYPEATNIGIWAKVATVPQGQTVNFKLSMVSGTTVYSESVFALAGPNVGAFGGWYTDVEQRKRAYVQGNGYPYPYEFGFSPPKMTPGLD